MAKRVASVSSACVARIEQVNTVMAIRQKTNLLQAEHFLVEAFLGSKWVMQRIDLSSI